MWQKMKTLITIICLLNIRICIIHFLFYCFHPFILPISPYTGSQRSKHRQVESFNYSFESSVLAHIHRTFIPLICSQVCMCSIVLQPCDRRPPFRPICSRKLVGSAKQPYWFHATALQKLLEPQSCSLWSQNFCSVSLSLSWSKLIQIWYGT